MSDIQEQGVAFSRTQSEPRLLHELFEAQVKRRPHHVAVEYNGKSLTYLELDTQAEKIAALCRQRGLGPGSFVALYSEKSLGLFAALLGVLKAGAAYVPIDPKFPVARVRSTIEDAHITLILSDGDVADTLSPQAPVEVLRISNEVEKLGEPSPPVTPLIVAAEDACYVIYTSGSTGRPKGVVIEHRHATNFVRSLRSVYGLTEDDRIYQGFSLAFDASVEEIWAAFSLGATLLVPSADIARSTFDASKFITQNRITYFSTVPSFLAMLPDDLPTVRLLVVGGEACASELVERWATPERRMLNTYGPTEATVVATAAECRSGRPVTIGRPLPGYIACVLDEQLHPTPVGEVGELFLGGESIARGYLNRTDLTAERFISCALGPSGSEHRLYRTFDLARMTAGGLLEFVGRADGQIKIRGFRVELSEIEAVLLEHPRIQAAVVNAVTIGSLKELAAYVVLNSPDKLERNSASELLRMRLPEYMIPRYLDIVQELPAMTSGKVDRNSLPAPCALLGVGERAIVKPSGRVETIVVEAFEKFLNQRPVSALDDFFTDLRGHSLYAAHIVTELRTRLNILDVSVPDLYHHRTARALALHLKSFGASGDDHPADARAEQRERSHELSWFRYLCIVLQLLGLLLYYSVVSAPLAIAVVLALNVRNGALEFWYAVDIATSVGCLVWPTWLLISVAVKWLVIGRYKPGRYRLWSFYYFRWWLSTRFQALSWSEMFVGTPLMSVYYRAMGARVGRNCTIGTPHCTAFDLISIGDETSIGADTHLLGHRVEDGWLILGHVTVGSQSYVGAHSCLGLNTTMGIASRLDDMSHLPDGASIAAGGGMRGSPSSAAKVDLGPLEPTVGRQKLFRRFMFGLLHLCLIYVMGYLLIASMLPGIALVLTSLYYSHWLLAIGATFIAVPSSVACYLVFILAVKWLAIGRVKPGVFSLYSGSYLKYWFLSYMLNNARNIAMPLYATLFLPPFLRLLGAKVGRGVEVSTAMHIMPDLLEIDSGSFLADACIVGGHRIHNGNLELRSNRIGCRSFIGNSAFIAPGLDVGDDALIGVMSTPAVGTQRVPSGTRWLGSPGFELPNTQSVACFSDAETFHPSSASILARSATECVRLLLPGFVAAAGLVIFCLMVGAAYQGGGYLRLGLVAPAAALGLSILSVSVAALIKILLIDRFEPTTRPLWSRYVWLTEIVNAVYESIAPTALAPLMGTIFMAPCLRMMGCKIGKWVFLETTLFSEFDLVTIGDNAALNLGATIQTHLFEDRVMKSDYLTIGNGCSVGNMAVLLYGTEMKSGSSLASMSVLMKGETLPSLSRWTGIPTRPEKPRQPSKSINLVAGSRRRNAALFLRRKRVAEDLLSSSAMVKPQSGPFTSARPPWRGLPENQDRAYSS